MQEYTINEDLKLIKELLGISNDDLSKELEVDIKTIARWLSNNNDVSGKNMEKIYSYAYKKGININLIKEMLNRDDNKELLLFHGAKKGLDGDIDIDKSDKNNDFGKGFYLSQSFEAAATYVAGFPNSSVYQILFDNKGLKYVTFHVTAEWMIAIAFYRGRIQEYADSKIVKKIVESINDADYIIAPIADNRMFSIINSFIDKEITDEQCKHCLSATNLGYQYVIKSPKAIKRLKIIEKCYLCSEEKNDYLEKRKDYTKLGDDKVKAARIKYRGIGKYIDELLGEK